MEKTKCKKRKSLKITYPVPYSESWNPDILPVLLKNDIRGNHSIFFKPKRTAESPKGWSRSFSAVRGPDPTAPHLKYGVFPRRRSPSSRTLPKSLKVLPKHDKRSHSNQIRKDFSSKKDLMIPATKKPATKSSISSDDWKKQINHVKRVENEYRQREIFQDDDNFSFIINTGQTTESPVIVFHNINKSFRRQLSLSETKHIDIKPKKTMSGPPSPLPLPNFTILPRKLTPIKL